MTVSPLRAALLAQATEADLSRYVSDTARAGGWDLGYHAWRSDNSAAGWPDWTFVHRRRRLTVFAELKGYDSRGRLGVASVEQLGWLAGLRDAGQFAYLWTPLDLELVDAVLLAGDVSTLPEIPEPTPAQLRAHARRRGQPDPRITPRRKDRP